MLNTTVALTPAACVAIPYATVNIESISCDREMVRSRKEVGGGKGQRQGTESGERGQGEARDFRIRTMGTKTSKRLTQLEKRIVFKLLKILFL